MEEVVLIVNPCSGLNRHKEKFVEAARSLCDSRGVKLEVEFTKGPGDARLLASEAAAKGAARVVVAGGDGTIKDTADGLWGTETVMGVVPMGSGNGLARSLGIPLNPLKALGLALTGDHIVIDRGIANGTTFYNAFGTGFDAEVSYKFARDGRRGKMTYVKHTLREMFSYKPRKFVLEYDGQREETEAMLIAVCNCEQYGSNAYIAPHADPSDGLLDVTILHGGSAWARMGEGIQLFTRNIDRNKHVDTLRARSIRIIGEEENTIHADGEPDKTEREISITCEPGGLRVVVKSLSR